MLIAVISVIAFALALTLAITSIGSAEGKVKTAREAPDSLVSAGTPRSQLELKRMFESMSLSYIENGKEVYEPISSEYRKSVDENSVLAVEEILFIISDTVSAYEKYDIIRMRDADGKIECEIEPFEPYQSFDKPFHRSAYDRIRAVSELIRLRVEYMSGEGAMAENADGGYRYAPRQVNKEGQYNDRAFLFQSVGVIFETGVGDEVVLYPMEKDFELCRTKVLLVTDMETSEAEEMMLSAAGYDPSRCRNITPEYWYGETDSRLFVLGGKVILADSDKAFEFLSDSEKLTSAAIAGKNLYFTSSSEKGSAVWKCSNGEAKKIFESAEEYLAVIEPLFSDKYDNVEVYAASPVDDGRFVVSIKCNGEPLAKYFAE